MYISYLSITFTFIHIPDCLPPTHTYIYMAPPTPLLFTMRGYEGEARVLSVYDGDTVTLAMPPLPHEAPNVTRAFRCRLLGIDTSELGTEAGARGRTFTREFLSTADNKCHVECHDFDKYGRVLVRIYVDASRQTCLNDALVEVGLATSYFGKGVKRGAPSAVLQL